jgi:anti-anti-sigma factor
MSDFNVSSVQKPQGMVVSAAGDVGMIELDELNKHLQSIIQQHPPLVVLDLAGITMLASAAMGALVAFRRDMGKAGSKVRLAALKPQVREAFRRAFLDKLFDIRDTVDAALV